MNTATPPPPPPSAPPVQAEIEGLVDAPTIRLATTGEEMEVVQYAPGKFAAKIPRVAIPQFGLIMLVAQPDGTFKPTVRVWSQHARLTEDLGKRLGLPIDRNTFVRLIKSEFIVATKPAPGTYLIDLVSLWSHFEDSRDPEFWTAKRRARYAENPY